MAFATIVCVIGLVVQDPPGSPTGTFSDGSGGFVTVAHGVPATDCIPIDRRREIESAIARYEAAKPPQAKQLAVAPLLPFPSLGGNSYEDVFPGGFVDLDPGPAKLDFSCHDFANDGHRGHDISLRSFAEQAVGVAVFAVRDGVVAAAQDGFPDMNTAGSIDAGNYLIIDHGGGQYGWYFHFKKNTVAFPLGQTVKQGDQLGLAASSGNSYGPHLHFEIQQSNAAVEPMAGPCGAVKTLFAKQPQLPLETKVLEFGVTTVDLFTSGVPHPNPQPKQAQVPLNAGFVYYPMQLIDIPANSMVREIFERPNGTIALDTGNWAFGNPTFLRFWPGFFYHWVIDMQSIAGTWRYRIAFNGKEILNAPIEVVAIVDPNFNRAPEPISVGFESPTASPSAALFCRVGSSVALEDLDWDLVRFRYVWKVNGATIRDVTTAGRRDAIPRGSFLVGDTVSCTVTPNDGKVNGAPASASMIAEIDRFTNHGGGKYGAFGVPYLEGSGSLVSGSSGVITLSQARPNSLALLFLGLGVGAIPLQGGTFVPSPILTSISLNTGANTGSGGGFTLPFVWPAGVPSGMTISLQTWIADPAAWIGSAASNGISMLTP